MTPITAVPGLLLDPLGSQPIDDSMPDTNSNVVQFPLQRRAAVRGCPQCGTCHDTWQIGRLIWGYCRDHEVRWVAADLKSVPKERVDRQQLRRGLEFLASYTEVSS